MRAMVLLGLAAGCSGSAGTVVARDIDLPRRLAIDEQFLYWTTASGSVRKLPLVGSTDPITLYTGGAAAADGFAIDATSAYLGQRSHDLQQPSIVRIPLAGGPSATLTTQVGAFDLAVADGTLYGVNGDLFAMPVAGGAVTVLAMHTGSQNEIQSVGVDADMVYVGDRDGYLGALPRAGGQGRSLGGCGNIDLAVGADAVYCVDNNAADIGTPDVEGRIVRADKATGTMKVLAMPRGPFAIAVDGDHIYWTELTRVIRANLDGSDQTVLADDQDSPGAIAISATDVYWATGAGEIRRAAK